MSKNREEASGSTKTFSEEKSSKLEWMYKSGTELLNRDEYLLGRPIDKHFEQVSAEETRQKTLPGVPAPKNHVEHECIPFSIRAYRSFQSDEQVDIQRKIVEDPLMLIRQKEMESRRKILENPVKLKELHRLLKQEKETSDKSKGGKAKKKDKKSTKERKRSKKKKKRRSNGSDETSSSDGEDLDTLLARKYRQIKAELGADDGVFDLKKLLNTKDKQSEDYEEPPKKQKLAKRDSNSSSDSDGATDNDRTKKYGPANRSGNSKETKKPFSERSAKYSKNETYDRNSKKKQDSRDRSRSTERHRNSSTKSTQQFYRDSSRKGRPSRERSPPPSRRGDRDDRQRRDSSPKKDDKPSKIDRPRRSVSSDKGREDYLKRKRSFGLMTASGDKIELRRSRSRSKSPRSRQNETSRSKPSSSQSEVKAQPKVRLTDEEKERKVREMMQNAQWRDKERKEKVQKYRDEYERDGNQTTKEFDRNFINKEMHRAMENQKSVESRLKSNINNIQRSGRAMESHFARR